MINKGSDCLNISISKEIKKSLIQDSVNNVGILQKLLLDLVEGMGIEDRCQKLQEINSMDLYHRTTLNYANQLDGLYQEFAKIVSAGIRWRKDATGIYAYTMKAIVEASDQKLLSGFSVDEIFDITHIWQERISKQNLRTILGKLEELQVDEGRRRLVVGYDESTNCVYIVDHQLLFYRKHHSMDWPWERLAVESIAIEKNQIILEGFNDDCI